MLSSRFKAPLVALAAALALSACASGPKAPPAPAPLSPKLVYVAPGPDVPPSMAAFVGRWEGTWGDDLDGKLAVQRVTAQGGMTGVYAWGDKPGRFEAGSSPVKGTIVGDMLTLETFGNGATARYKLIDPDTLRGEYVLPGNTSVGFFRRAP